MEHFFKDIRGWFNYDNLYKDMIDKATDAHFVEIGAYLGKSTSFMAVEIINSKKNIRFDVIDPWGVEKCPNDRTPYLNKKWEDVYTCFLKSMFPVLPHINVLRTSSLKASKLYKDQSLNFVFIDGCHCFNCVNNDIVAWLPKIKPNGTLAGHDFSLVWPSVRKAVVANFSNHFTTNRSSWIHKIKAEPCKYL